MSPPSAHAVEILLVEDNPSDVDMTLDALRASKVINNVSIAKDGVEAMRFLRREGTYLDAPRPDLILLDLNLPKKDGREVLAEVKEDPNLKDIPIVVLTTSDVERDILESYRLHANCYVSKPVDFLQFAEVIRSIDSFWLTVVRLPPAGK